MRLMNQPLVGGVTLELREYCAEYYRQRRFPYEGG